ncbi:hypothetical protein [Sphingomicrobium flavum]|uniref:hypothetical protein n=1 Tax=Sphingomicrobium flavum TaxID=1229164 RepID=UPI0021ADE04F|nr:hypothetical protein [Sphingomicrobium flavum]
MERQIQYFLRDCGIGIAMVAILFIGFMLFDWGLKALAGVAGASVLGIGLMMRHFGWHFAHKVVTEQVKAADERLFGERQDKMVDAELPDFDPDAAFERYMEKRMRGEVTPVSAGAFGRKGAN